jgi:hypothetical protein
MLNPPTDKTALPTIPAGPMENNVAAKRALMLQSSAPPPIEAEPVVTLPTLDYFINPHPSNVGVAPSAHGTGT